MLSLHAMRVASAAILLAPSVAGTRKGAGGGACDFDIHYNRWVQTFVPTEYEHNGRVAGLECLEACCKDPSCAGLAIESSLESQCYRYPTAPKELAAAEKKLEDVTDHGHGGVPLATFLAGDRVPEWSVLIKRVPPAASASAPAVQVVSDSLRRAVVTRPRRVPNLASKEAALDRQLRNGLAAQPPHCQWKVHYDTWRGNFASGEYMHDLGDDRMSCLEHCCADPSCTGLQMESTEKFQCYKYTKPPVNLAAKQSLNLGDGAWLRRKPAKWSVFVKEAVRPGLAPKVSPESAVGLVTAVTPSPRYGVMQWIVLVLTLAAVVAIVVDNASSAARLARRASRLHSGLADKLGLHKGGESEQLLLLVGSRGAGDLR